MDISTLEQNLEVALTQVITDENTLQAAITAVQGVIGTDPNDAIVTALVGALTAAGYSVTAPVVAGSTGVAIGTADTSV